METKAERHCITDTVRRLKGLRELIESPVYMPARFWAKFSESEGGCWEWQGSKSNLGYGRYGTTAQWGTPLVHRQSYVALVGAIPENLELDHLCRNRACGNPEHLEPVTHRVNLQRGAQGAKTHCKHGHELTGDNLYLARRKDGSHYRQCRPCVLRRLNERRKATR